MNVKSDFPIFEEPMHKNLVYLDSAATTQKPKDVINAVTDYYKKENANPGRGIYDLSQKSTEAYENARTKVAEFVRAKPEEIIFTKGTTDSLNMLAHCILPLLPKGRSEIVLTEMEHHSNLVQWQEFAKRHKFTLKFIPTDENFMINIDQLGEVITEKTALVCVTAASNILGTINATSRICALAKNMRAISVVDAAQHAASFPINVKTMGCDFLAFSGHKMYGPMGIGVLYGKRELLEKMNPISFGGGMVEQVSFESASYRNIPHTFEAGTPNVAGAVGLAAAVEYLYWEISELDIEIPYTDSLKHYELTKEAYEKLSALPFVKLYCAKPEVNIGIISFTVDGVHPHDVASILNEEGIAIRAGHMCAAPLIEKIGSDSLCRISFGLYNTSEDIDKLIEGLKKVLEVFKK